MTNWHAQETYKSLISLSIEVLRAMILVNGGAALALLTFWGNQRSAPNLPLTWPLRCFAIGVAAAVFAGIVGYLTQLQLYNESVRISEGQQVSESHVGWLRLGISLAVLSVVLFVLGCTFAANALSTTATTGP